MRTIGEGGMQRGDTVIEVMFAFAVFAAVAVGSMGIMNSTSAIAQRSLEITQVRSQMDAQADAIRFIHQRHVANYPTVDPEWNKMTVLHKQTTASQFGLRGETVSCPAITSTGRSPFILNARQAKVWGSVPLVETTDGTLPPYSQVVYESDGSINQAYGIWVEAVPTAAQAKRPGFVDFHIRACWPAAGAVVPMTLGTIVRLYEPIP